MLSFFAVAAQGQSEDDDPTVDLDSLFPIPQYYYDLAADTCRYPVLEEVSVVHYANFAKLYIKSDVPQVYSYRIFSPTASGDSGYVTVTSEDGILYLTGLIRDTLYEVRMLDNCGNPTEPLEISTRKEIGRAAISLPLTFYRQITDYLKQEEGPLPFDVFLQDAVGISPIGKQAFIQDFFYKGAPFDADPGTLVPTLPEFRADTCFCNSISTATFATPANVNYVNTGYTDYSHPGSGPNKKTIEGWKNTGTWRWLQNQGAAKWHILFTEGFKADKGQLRSVNINTIDSTQSKSERQIGIQQSWIRVAFICLNGDRLPEACECEKQIRFWSRYDSHATGHSYLREKSGGEKKSFAEAEDVAFAVFSEEGNIAETEVRSALFCRAQSRCEITPNPEFWTTVAKLAGNSTSLIISLLGIEDFSKLTQAQRDTLAGLFGTFFNGIADLINTPYLNPNECDNQDDQFRTMADILVKPLRPNKPVQYTINSHTRLHAGGQRSWHSWARIHSNQYIAAFISSDEFSGEPRHCCSPRIGAWVVSSCDGPLSHNMLKTVVRSILEPWLGAGAFWPTFAFKQSQFHYGLIATASLNEECNRILIYHDGGNGSEVGSGGYAPGNDDRSSAQYSIEDLAVVRILVWDANGRQIAHYQNKSGIESDQLWAELRNTLSLRGGGFYFVQLITGGKVEVFKVFVP